jgi:hypothetical protein
MRKFLPASALAVAVLGAVLFPAAAPAQSGGGCQLHGTASFNPGLTNTAQSFNYSFAGDLTNCKATETGSPATGTVEAGKVYTNPATGQQFQEPVPTGQGSCSNGTTAGTALARWADGTVTVVNYQTDAVAAAVHLSGTVAPSVTLQAINPQVGQPTSITITTTRFAGASALGALAFEADPTACVGAGLASAGIDGVIGLGSS